MKSNITNFLNSKSVELKSQKIELANLNEVVSIHKEISKSNTDLKGNILTYRSFESALIKKYKELEAELKNNINLNAKADSIKSELKKQIQDLGLNIKDVKEGGNLEMAQESSKDFIQGAKQINEPKQ